MALAQLLQPWADESRNYMIINMKNQYSRQQVVHRESPDWRETCVMLVCPDITKAIAPTDANGPSMEPNQDLKNYC